MDAIDLLLLASQKYSNDNLQSRKLSIPEPIEKTRKLSESDTVEAIDAILFLSGRTTTGSDSTRTVPRDSLSDNEREHDKRNDSHDIPTDIFPRLRRARSMSEPWDAPTDYASWVNRLPSPLPPLEEEHTTDNPDTIASFFEKYASIYNQNGRVGIYTKEERSAIIQRYREKRKRRNWKKQVRYTCRKDLADRRIRIRGRFVKLDDLPRNVVQSYLASFSHTEEDDTQPIRRQRSNSLTSGSPLTLNPQFFKNPLSPALNDSRPVSSLSNQPPTNSSGLHLHLRSPQSTTSGKSDLTINLFQMRTKRDQYQQAVQLVSHRHHLGDSKLNTPVKSNTPVDGTIGENQLPLQSLLGQHHGHGLHEDEDDEDATDYVKGKKLRRHSIAY